jgi:cholesterol transport system auxiliary component
LNARRLAALAAAPALALSLSACISVLPKSDPDQLYSFGTLTAASAAAAPAAVPGAAPVGVLLGAVTFPRASTGDGILTVTGGEYAYIGKSRWVAPATVLFREAVESRFDAAAQRVSLIRRGENGRAGLVLRLDVRDFAAVYPNGAETPPTVAVSVRGRLTTPDGRLAAERNFDIRRPAPENRVGPITQTFDAAVLEALNEIVAWSDEVAVALPADLAVPAVPTPAPAAARPRLPNQ